MWTAIYTLPAHIAHSPCDSGLDRSDTLTKGEAHSGNIII